MRSRPGFEDQYDAALDDLLALINEKPQSNML